MARLNQIVAIEKGVKERMHNAISALYKLVQKPALFTGFSKTYAPKDEGGDARPAESNKVQVTVPDTLAQLRACLGTLMEVEARKDWSNTEARADVVVDGVTVLAAAPTTFLLFLEKQLTDFRTFVAALPTLDPALDWEVDSNDGLYKSQAVQTQSTKTTQKPIVLYPATDKHPAQTQLIQDVQIIGYWSDVKQSGAIKETDKRALVARAEALLDAVKTTRSKANEIEEVAAPDTVKAVFGFLLPAS